MNKPKLNGFWAGMLGAGVLLVILFVALVVPQVASQDTLQKRLRAKVTALNDAIPGTPSDKDVEGWATYKDEIIKAYDKITKFYADSDKSLEQWFPGLQDPPPRGAFVTKLDDERQKLESALTAEPHKIVIGPKEDPGPGKPTYGFNWEVLDFAHWQAVGIADEPQVLKDLQKRYWARQRVANIFLGGKVKVSRIVHFQFFRKLHPKLAGVPWENHPQGAELILWQGIGADPGSGQPRGFQEWDLPNELGKTLTFGFAVALPYSEVPKLVREIANPDNNPSGRLLINTIGTHVTIREQNEPLVKYTYELGNAQDQATKKAAAEKGIRPQDVLLAVTCQIIDFDATKVKQPTAAK